MPGVLMFKDLPALPGSGRLELLFNSCKTYGAITQVSIENDQRVGYVHFQDYFDAVRALKGLQGCSISLTNWELYTLSYQVQVEMSSL